MEILLAPTPPSQPSFTSQPPPSHHRHNQQHRERHMTSSLHLSTSANFRGWDSLSSTTSPRSRSNSETSLASLLLLQQQIQQRNYIRQFAPPISDPHLPPDFSTKRMSRYRERVWEPSEQEKRAVEEKDGRRKEARVKAEALDEGLAQRYGAMRIKGQLFSNFNVKAAEEEGGEGGSRRGLRHMFSNPILGGEEGVVVNGGRLRESRAKPPIRIALSTSTSRGVKKKPSSRNVLSPTTIHSPPPCPPPASPLPDLPAPPKSAPLASAHAVAKRGLVSKRSFIRSSSTPVSPLAPPSSQKHVQGHGLSQSRCQNPLSPQRARESGERWIVSPTTTAETYDSSLLTPLLTGLPSLVFDRQPNTPQSAAVVTPVKPSVAGPAEKFEILFAFLSSKSHSGNDRGDKGNGGSPRSAKTARG